ncbi:MAG TPA: UDP-3-O-acyl-N-acetylglucosamine deacetylase, partial [Ignavibacteriaceae bacterium]|nr:UDP-3-O-acyl-N-acetylglucosamine deacetylase [Ignavibacteriaceae bacterium]
MIELQRTISKPATLSGIGLHTGTECTMTFKPAPINSGIKFIRIDLGGNPEIPAIADNVVDVSRGTTIGIGDAKVYTVEHVLAAIAGLQIDNISIELDGIEPPIGDGSAISYVNALLDAGIEKQDAPKDYLIIDETVTYSDESRQVDIVALPLDQYRLTVMVDYQNPALGSQHTGLFDLDKEFVNEFASARTFCFLSEVEELANQGLIKGGDMDNAVVIVDNNLNQDQLDELGKKIGLKERFVLGDDGILNNKKLRFKNEPVRHKLLDLIGDLALIGAPI